MMVLMVPVAVVMPMVPTVTIIVGKRRVRPYEEHSYPGDQ
jgi:hypothetical protein